MREAAGQPRRRADILTQQVQETQVLLNLKDGQYYALDEVGIRIWELCDGQHSLAEISAILAHEYDAPAETIAADVVELVGDLVDAQLLVMPD